MSQQTATNPKQKECHMGMTGLILAYLDPGSGSIILQIVAVALMSVGVFFRHAIGATIGRVFGWVKRSKDV